MSDLRDRLDDLRERDGIARDDDSGHVVVCRHADVLAIAADASAFSNASSRFLQIPNGLDGDEHARYRALIDRYLNDPDELAAIARISRACIAELLGELRLPAQVEAVAELGARFAVRVQLRWLGWDPALEARLLAWVDDNRQATRVGSIERTTASAAEFNAILRSELDARRDAAAPRREDPTSRLMRDESLGRRLSDEELVSILRNWTAGDLSSLALCTGVVTEYVASHRPLQDELRDGVPDEQIDRCIDEMLRIDDPFVSNRRVVVRDTEVGGRTFRAGERVELSWTAANRDPRAFGGDPDAFCPERGAARNLVYGAGPHVCPGRRLSTIELREFLKGLLAATTAIELAPDDPPVREQPPASGYRAVPVRLR